MNKNLRRILSYVIGAVGFVAALIAIHEFFWPIIDPEKILLTPEAKTTILSSNMLETNRPIVGDEVVVGGRLNSSDAIYVVANHLHFGESGSLKAPRVVIFATRITRGSLDVSGDDATSSGGPGTEGGSIFVAAARLYGTQLDASGGNGAEGQDGRNGTPG